MRYPKPSWMNSDLELYRSNIRRFVEAEIKPHQHKWAKQQHVDRELWTKAGEMGLLSADIPEEYGGAGVGLAVVRGVARGHGGSVVLRSPANDDVDGELLQGASFSMVFARHARSAQPRGG